jgi:hypothetical protein
LNPQPSLGNVIDVGAEGDSGASPKALRAQSLTFLT